MQGGVCGDVEACDMYFPKIGHRPKEHVLYRDGNDFVAYTVVVKVEGGSVCRNSIVEMPGVAAESDSEVVLTGFLGKKTMSDGVVIEFVEVGYTVGLFIEVAEREVLKGNSQAKVRREAEVG